MGASEARARLAMQLDRPADRIWVGQDCEGGIQLGYARSISRGWRGSSPAGIDPPASFHILRHTYATHLLQAGAPLPVIAANLGHSDTRMTERHYAHLVPSHVPQVIRATMPKLGLVDPSPVVPLGQSATAALQRLRSP